jgi:predicted peroxiredoxin
VTLTEVQELHIVLVSNEPERVYPALTLILTASTLGVKSYLYCTMKGLDVVRKDLAGKISMPGMPPVENYLKDALSLGAIVSACAPSRKILEDMGINEQTIYPGVQTEDAIAFLEKALAAAKRGGIVLFV